MISCILFFLIFVFQSGCQNNSKGVVDGEEQGPYRGYLLKKMLKVLPDLVQKWKEYKQNLGLNFSTEQDRYYFFVFGKNMVYIRDFMQDEHRRFDLEPNALTHKSREEYFKLMGVTNSQGEYPEDQVESDSRSIDETLIEASEINKDWTKEKKVTKVKDQGSCGGCYAFATVASVESAIAIKTGKLQTLSEQAVIDCSYTYGNALCEGGTLDRTFKYMISNPVPYENQYPYKAKNGTCTVKSDPSAIRISNFRQVKRYDEDDLSKSVQNFGPVAVSIDARWDSFRFYKSGILSEPKCSQTILTHGVAVVGAMSTPNAYYIVKNSYSASYGQGGYVLIARNQNNMCGIASVARYPII